MLRSSRSVTARSLPLLGGPLLALFLLLATGMAQGAPGSSPGLRLQQPTDYQVQQRESRTEGQVIIAGELPQPSTSPALLESRLTVDGITGAWKSLGSIPAGQTRFRQELTVPAGGWHRLEIRARLDATVLGESKVEHLGVGEVFVVAGQSNSANHGEERQISTTGRIAAFTGTDWRPADDPQPGASGDGGSFLPPFADELARRLHVPIGLVPTGVGATSVREWLPAGTRFPHPPTLEGNVRPRPEGDWECRGTLFSNFVARLKPLGSRGFRAVLWHQGESDANQRDASRTLPGSKYVAFMELLIRESRRAIGWDAPWFVAQASYHTPDDPGSPDLRAAQQSLATSGLALAGPDTDALTGRFRDGGGRGVHFSGPGLREHAARWVEKVLPWLEPQLAAAKPGPLHWAFLPVQRPELPAGVDPIDTLIHAQLAARQLAPNPPAAPRDLLRRLSFDLVGLPPSPAELEAFERDPSPAHYSRIVETLLASPHYGERWGRHWLDVVRYTESQGFEYDRPRDHAWPYRDYVIRSFNEDKPYDRFLREQIAGDVLEPVSTDGILGAGLLVCGPWDQAGNSQANATQRAITREEEMEDLLSVVGQTFLGLTLNCARCHDHKFDPVPLAEYYRVKAVFDGVKHGDRPLPTAADNSTNAIAVANSNTHTHVNAPTNRPAPMAYAGTRQQPTPTRVLRRGDVKSPGEVVAPAALSAVPALTPELGLAPDAPEAQRRLKFADWLADPRNPLPARVIANRVWQYHFGQGLVATPSDFGANGARPTHPELLDWLAAELVERGWSLKALHRLIVHSATYQQSTRHQAQAATVDADNQLLWRYPPRRLEAEVVRDAMLAVSGQINLRVGGPSFRPFTTTEYGATFYHLVDQDGPEFNRRTVYRMNINSGKEPMLDAFDCPDPSIKTPRRGVTTTPLQALSLMNSPFVQRQARHLAQRAKEVASSSSAEPNAHAPIQAAYQLALGRPPAPDELQRAAAAVSERGLTNLCWTLLNSTEFLYVR